jgi:hypothetical protein
MCQEKKFSSFRELSTCPKHMTALKIAFKEKEKKKHEKSRRKDFFSHKTAI